MCGASHQERSPLYRLTCLPVCGHITLRGSLTVCAVGPAILVLVSSWLIVWSPLASLVAPCFSAFSMCYCSSFPLCYVLAVRHALVRQTTLLSLSTALHPRAMSTVLPRNRLALAVQQHPLLRAHTDHAFLSMMCVWRSIAGDRGPFHCTATPIFFRCDHSTLYLDCMRPPAWNLSALPGSALPGIA